MGPLCCPWGRCTAQKVNRSYCTPADWQFQGVQMFQNPAEAHMHVGDPSKLDLCHQVMALAWITFQERGDVLLLVYLTRPLSNWRVRGGRGIQPLCAS